MVSARRQRGKCVGLVVRGDHHDGLLEICSCQLISRFSRISHLDHGWRDGEHGCRPLLFDYSGTLFRLEEDDSWFEGIEVDERQIDGHVQAELMRRLTAPTGRSVDMTPEAYHAWVEPRPGTAPAPRGLSARAARVRAGRPSRRVAVRPGDRPVVLDAVSRHRRRAQGPAPAGHQDRGGLQHRVRRAAGFRGTRRRRRRRRVRAVLRGRRRQARCRDLRNRAVAAGGRRRDTR